MLQLHDPAELGFDPTRLSRIDDLMDRYVADGKLPGFVTLVARRGKIAYLKSCGLMDREVGKPYQDDTIIRIYSMTKPIASAALMMLYEQALFNLHDPVAAYIPAFKETQVYEDGNLVPQKTPMNIQHLLTHSAGLTYGGFGAPDRHPVDYLYDEAKLFEKGESLTEKIDRLAALPLRYQPGTQWHYGMATDVVGRLVEVLSGQTLGDFIAKNICEPLGMIDTSFEVDPAKLDRLATLYHVTAEDPLAVLDHPSESQYLPPVVAHSGGGGLLSTMHDYFRFASCLLNKGELDGARILGRKTVERMQMNHMHPSQLPLSFEFSDPYYGCGFGLGFACTIDVALSGQMGSNGDYWWGGYAETSFWVDPAEEIVCINMTQCIPSGFYPIRKQFRTAVYQALVD